MLEQMKDYTKCAVRNRFVLGGYVGLAASIIIGTQVPYLLQKSVMFAPLDPLLFVGSVDTLLFTGFGAGTYSAYKRFSKMFEEHGERTLAHRSLIKRLPYCLEVGFESAREEFELM